jgi:polysaccharide biosynthesis/export protein
VLVTGAVGFESRVRYERGLDVNDYLERAGGVREDGDEKRVSVRYPNGELRTTRTILGVRSYPDVQPGSTITVPVEPNNGRRNFDEVLTRTLTILSTLATLIVAVRAVQ